MLARLLLCLACLSILPAGEAARSAFFNQRVSTRTVALNQPVRLELTTVPRQVESANIEAAVADAVALGAAQAWRLVGRPAVQTDEKTRTVRVSLVLLARQVGEVALPVIPVSWLSGEQLAEFGHVSVTPNLMIGSETHPLPAELTGVGGFAWGAKLDDVRAQIGEVAADGERSVARPRPGLELHFRQDTLVEAAISVEALGLEAARASFLARWGSPQVEEGTALTWVLGWTRIVATPTANGGMRLALAREDLLASQTRARIADSVFGLLEGR